jgi:formyltetrahydrofolate synthetase
MAKTQFSLSTDASVKGVPTGFTIKVLVKRKTKNEKQTKYLFGWIDNFTIKVRHTKI